MISIRTLLALLSVASLAALLQGLLSDWPEHLDLAADPYRQLMPLAADIGSPLWVDVRSQAAYRQQSLAGALHLDLSDWESGFSELLERWDGLTVIVVFCDGGGCAASREIAARLRAELGVDAVFWLDGGWDSVQHETGTGQ